MCGVWYAKLAFLRQASLRTHCDMTPVSERTLNQKPHPLLLQTRAPSILVRLVVLPILPDKLGQTVSLPLLDFKYLQVTGTSVIATVIDLRLCMVCVPTLAIAMVHSTAFPTFSMVCYCWKVQFHAPKTSTLLCQRQSCSTVAPCNPVVVIFVIDASTT